MDRENHNACDAIASHVPRRQRTSCEFRPLDKPEEIKKKKNKKKKKKKKKSFERGPIGPLPDGSGRPSEAK
jgi:hypothetical protein